MSILAIWIMSMITITWVVGLGLLVYKIGDDNFWWDDWEKKDKW